ncbi:hypothetical protein HON36_03765 [Candidatus Parcubacteria bacterium]|nr:hypothetical protein [Candidatus Parcubacteria bacterium]
MVIAFQETIDSQHLTPLEGEEMNDGNNAGGYKFVGTTQECLIAYGETLATGRAAKGARKPMADYTNMVDRAVYRWVTGSVMPIGENLVRCRVFLERQGYLCQELKAIHRCVRRLAEIFSDGEVTFDFAQESLGFKAHDSLLALLVGRQKFSSRQSARDKWNRFLAPYKKKEEANKPTRPMVSSHDPDSLRHQATIGVLGHQVQAMMPVAMYLLSDKFSDAERRELRNSIPDDGLQELARMLLALCSKESRKIFMAELKAQIGKVNS